MSLGSGIAILGIWAATAFIASLGDVGLIVAAGVAFFAMASTIEIAAADSNRRKR